jgi:hypothetical protein
MRTDVVIYNDLPRIRRMLNMVSPDIEWLADRVPALVEEIEFLRYSLNQRRDESELMMTQVIVRRTRY